MKSTSKQYPVLDITIFLAAPIFVLIIILRSVSDVYASIYILIDFLIIWVIWNLLCFNIGNQKTIIVKIILGGVFSILLFLSGFILTLVDFSFFEVVEKCIPLSGNLGFSILLSGLIVAQIMGALRKLNTAIDSESLQKEDG